MTHPSQRKVTVIYYTEGSLELKHDVKTFEENMNGRVVIPNDFKEDKSIIAVCDGEIEILNKVGERILSVKYTA
ncbi:TIGR02922 family protein [Pseudocolwellia agarivorans]|uniref:TIGR02922 family protein n=1 Tax=Pseudocolwellia agarivorans TaxID=1911682 RepID=UPI000987CFC6|nr:TIGR02922 family protein [Pseudocolwellia agarivorans]